MRKIIMTASVVLLLAIPAGIVAADQVELTNRERGNGDVQTIVLDDQTNEVTIAVNGTPTTTRRATQREIAAADRIKADQARKDTLSLLSTLMADLEANPAVQPDLIRIETALVLLAQLHGVE